MSLGLICVKKFDSTGIFIFTCRKKKPALVIGWNVGPPSISEGTYIIPAK